jgi:transposase
MHIENFYLSCRQIAKRLNFSRRTVSKVLKRFNETLTVERAPGSGGQKGPVNPNLTRKVLKSIENNCNLSDRDRARKLGTSRENVCRIRIRNGFKSFKAIKHPNRSDKQDLAMKKRTRLLYDKILTKHGGCLVMDDETYVKMDFRQLPGQKYYVSRIRGQVPDKFKYIYQDKFAKKLMIWQGICSCGRKSHAYIVCGNMNADLYIKECLKKRLLPLLNLLSFYLISLLTSLKFILFKKL